MPQQNTVMIAAVTMTVAVEPMISRRVDQLTFFISPSVATRKSTVYGYTNTNQYMIENTTSPMRVATPADV